MMTEVNLQPSWPSYQSHNMYFESTVFINRVRLYTIPGKIYLAMLGATCIGQSSMWHIHNYLFSEGHLVLPL